MKKMKTSKQMSESLELGIVLALAGGFMDSYSYMCRGSVFANAQTGNMLLLGIHLSSGNWGMALRYLLPVLSFAIGIATADIVRFKTKDHNIVHWRQITVLFEAAMLIVVSMIPLQINLIANSLTSLACGIQVESFRKIRGNGIATTMCIGNLRSGTQNLCEYFQLKKKNNLKKSLLYYGIIFCFIIGAIIGNRSVLLYQTKAILICPVFLVIAFLMMFINGEKKGKSIGNDKGNSQA
jgi:uncharacterized membrane protein YoaK (UPF0700 family)